MWMAGPDIRRRALRFAAPVLAVAAGAAAGAFARETGAELGGRRIAETYCAQCHALGSGPSPLAEAPPFATLHLRYPKDGGLRGLLSEGMIAPTVPPEEGQPRMHPRMPQAHLDEDQVADLIAFLKAVQSRSAECSSRGS